MSERMAFAVDLQGVATELTISEKLSAAYDILAADNADMERWATTLSAAERDGMDPVALANKVVLLRHALKEPLIAEPEEG